MSARVGLVRLVALPFRVPVAVLRGVVHRLPSSGGGDDDRLIGVDVNVDVDRSTTVHGDGATGIARHEPSDDDPAPSSEEEQEPSDG